MKTILICLLLISLSLFPGCKQSDNGSNNNNNNGTPTPVDKSLVLYLPLDGNLIDQSSYAHTGIIDSASFTQDRNSKINGSGLFDSTFTYIRIPNSSPLDTMKYLTLSAWVKPVSFEGIGNNTIINKGFPPPFQNPYYQYHLGITGNKYPNFPGSFLFSVSLSNQNTTLVSAIDEWSIGNWYHVAGTYDGENLKLYVNGALQVSLGAQGTIDHFERDVYIGKTVEYTKLPSNTPGAIDEVRIYSRALTAAEILSLYNQ
jgi:hypothetical protein